MVARAADLPGAQVILTGVSPTLAEALVEVGTDMGATVSLGTLENGIAYALKRRISRRLT